MAKRSPRGRKKRFERDFEPDDKRDDHIKLSGVVSQVFAGGQYEDQIVGNSSWSTGDWNCDGEFTSQDIILALQSGGYSPGSIPSGSA